MDEILEKINCIYHYFCYFKKLEHAGLRKRQYKGKYFLIIILINYRSNGMKKITLIIICLLFSGLIQSRLLIAQNVGEGGISSGMLEQIRSSVKMDETLRARINAVSNNDLKKLALNREITGKTDHFFAHKINNFCG